MKTSKVSGLGFGFSAVNAGKRAVVVEPQLVVSSTEGGFRVTAPVTRLLGIANGDYIMFITNVDKIDEAITLAKAGSNDERADVINAFCAEQGYDLNTPEAVIALHKEFDLWAIAKGVQEFDGKGNPKIISERLTLKDKKNYVENNFDAMMDAAMSQADDETKAALTREDITRDEQVEILANFVVPREVNKFTGSKTASSSNQTGTGMNLNFTDSNVWKQLKADMGDDAKGMNRVFDVDIDNVQKIVVNNGYENITVNAMLLGDYVDKEPARIGSKDDSED